MQNWSTLAPWPSAVTVLNCFCKHRWIPHVTKNILSVVWLDYGMRGSCSLSVNFLFIIPRVTMAVFAANMMLHCWPAGCCSWVVLSIRLYTFSVGLQLFYQFQPQSYAVSWRQLMIVLTLSSVCQSQEKRILWSTWRSFRLARWQHSESWCRSQVDFQGMQELCRMS